MWVAEAGAALAVVYLLLAARYPEKRILEAPATAALVLSVLLVLAPAASGHASVGGLFTFVVDVVHVEAAAAWTGGLLFLLLALRFADDRWARAREWVPAFSALAVLSVAVLLVAGVINGYLEVRTWSGLWETTYGRLLLVKVALVLPLLALGLTTTASPSGGSRQEPSRCSTGAASSEPPAPSSRSSSRSWR